ncbi:hypothetical protein KEM48_002730 [Puccinia striiformis f. sp. tritici PST-130]|nr:hypothetical protein KEM48_002730 [Puccinia striiformis f. sp. tritici PST-130]
MDNNNSFSVIDQLRPYSDYRGLLEEDEGEHLDEHIHADHHTRDYYFQSNSQLSRWELLISWLSSKTLERISSTKPSGSFECDLQTSALPHSIEADALLLDDISIALRARSSSRKTAITGKSKSFAPRSHQPQPIPSPSVTSMKNDSRRQSWNSAINGAGTSHQTISPVLAKKKQTQDSIKDLNMKPLTDQSLSSSSSSSQKKRNKSRSKSSKGSSSVYTDETVESEQSSVPSLTTSRTTRTSTATIESSPSSHSLELNAEIIKFIHTNYNSQCRRLYGRDLSRAQIQQLCAYLISRKFDHSNVDSCAELNGATAGNSATLEDHDKADGSSGGFVEDHQRAHSVFIPPTIEIESLKRIQLSSTEFLQAIKQTKTCQQQQPIVPTDTKNSSISPPVPTTNGDLFESELEDDDLASASFLDWFHKGSQITSDFFNNLSDPTHQSD